MAMNTPHFSRAFILRLVICLLLGTCALAGNGVNGERLLVGQSLAITGPRLENGFHYLKGLRAALAEVNEAGGVAGRRIDLVTMDDGGDAARASANTRKLLEEDDVVALIGYTGAATSLAALPLAEQAGVPFIAPCSGAMALRQGGRMLFPLRADYGQELARVLKQLNGMGLRRLAVVYQTDVLGADELASLDAGLKHYQMTQTARRTVSDTNQDYGALVAALVQTQPEAILVATAGDATASFVRAWRHSSGAAQLIGLSVLSPSQLRRDLGAEAGGVGLTQVVPSPWSLRNPSAKAYRLALKRFQQSDELHHAGLEGYLAGLLLAEGLRRAPAPLSRKTLIYGLEQLGRFQVAGFGLEYSAAQHTGSGFIDLSVIGATGDFLQ